MLLRKTVAFSVPRYHQMDPRGYTGLAKIEALSEGATSTTTIFCMLREGFVPRDGETAQALP
jgi:hypothetical protein